MSRSAYSLKPFSIAIVGCYRALFKYAEKETAYSEQEHITSVIVPWYYLQVLTSPRSGFT